MYVDPSGHVPGLVLALLIAGGLAIGFGGTALADYLDDEKAFNGSISTESYVANTLVMGLFGLFAGIVGPSSFTLSYPTLTLMQTTMGTTMLVVGTGTVVVSGGTVVIGAGTLLGGLVLFSSHNRPGNNRVQNKQFEDAARVAGYNPKDPMIRDELNKIHQFIRKNKLNLGWKELLQLIKEWLG